MDIRDNIKLEVIESQPYTGDLNARALDMWITLNGFKMIDPTVTIQVKGYNNGFKDTVVTADDKGKYRYIIPPELQSAGSLKLEVYVKQNDLVKVMGVYYKQVIPNEMGVLVPAEHLPTYEDFYRMYNDVKTGITVNSSNVKITPAGNIQSLNIQDAINELDTEKVPITTKVNGKPLSGDITLKAADIGNTPSGTISATNVQNAINELEAEKVNKTDNDLSLSTKSDKVFATNLIDDGDFSSGTINGWTKLNSNIAYNAGGYIDVTGSGRAPTAAMSKPLPKIPKVGDKLYVKTDVKVNVDSKVIRAYIGDTMAILTGFLNPSTFSNFSGVITANTSTYPYITLYTEYADATSAVNKTSSWDNIVVLNLTDIFGAGNEPTKEFMDRILAEFPNKFFNGTVELFNAKNLPEFLDDKANKVQEAWITPTLLNGYIGVIKYRKNQFGRTEIEGAIYGGTTGQVAFVIPSSYAPMTSRRFANCVNGGVGNILVEPSGNCTPSSAGTSHINLSFAREAV